MDGESNLLELWKSMGMLCHGVVIVLAVMFVRSVVVGVSRFLRYRAARRQSILYIERSAAAFREGKLEEAISAAEVSKESHIASVVAAGLMDFTSASSKMTQTEVIENVKLSLERSAATTQDEMKRGLSGLATIAATAPFVGLFGTVIGILDAFKNIGLAHTTVIKVIAGSISEALLTTAIGLSVAVPSVWCYNHLTNQMDAFGTEMTNSGSELVSYLQTRLAEGKRG